jgi:hypothetical protein
MKQLLFLALLFPCFLTSNVLDDLIIKKNPTINMILIELLASGLDEETFSTKYPESLSKEVCLAGGVDPKICSGKYPYSSSDAPKTFAQGICLAGGVDPKICSGKYPYSSRDAPKTFEEAINMIPYKDRNYWWDRFRDQYGNYHWRCRGGQTKQFAENSKCSRVRKDDGRWPG